MEDLEIIELYWSRDEAAIRETDVKYGRMLTCIAQNILDSPEDSAETVNDTYGKVWSTIPPRRPGVLAAYLGRIARNLSINRWHRNRAVKRGGGAEALLSELSDCVPASGGVEMEIEARELSAVIGRWLCGLSQDDRVLFLRRYWFGDPVGRLAEESGTTPNKLAGRLYRLRQSLRAALGREGVKL